jgi:hypothetical protein
MDVLPGNVGDEFLITIALPDEDDAAFLPVPAGSETFGAEEKTKFKWHIEARQTRFRVEFGLGNVVDGKTALSNDSADLVDPVFCAVIGLERAPRQFSLAAKTAATALATSREETCVAGPDLQMITPSAVMPASPGLRMRPEKGALGTLFDTPVPMG